MIAKFLLFGGFLCIYLGFVTFRIDRESILSWSLSILIGTGVVMSVLLLLL